MTRSSRNWYAYAAAGLLIATAAFSLRGASTGRSVESSNPAVFAATPRLEQHRLNASPGVTKVSTHPKRYGKVEHVGQDDFDKKVLKSDIPVLVDFYADWCGPCRLLAPTLEQLARELPDVKVVKIDVDRSQELAARYRINAIPSLLVIKKGKVTAKHVGLANKDALKQLLAR